MHRFLITGRSLAAVVAFVLAILPTTGVAQDFQVIVALSPVGRAGSFQPVWRFNVAGTGGEMTQLSDIPASATNDPFGATFLTQTELLVGNRHAHDGNGSISRFEFSPDLSTFVQLSTVSGGGLSTVVQIAIDYDRGEIFAVNAYTNTVSWFSYDGAGNFTPIGIIPCSFDGRGVALSPDGNTLYVSAPDPGTPYIMRFARGAGTFTEISPIEVSGGVVCHNLKMRNGELFIGDAGAPAIHRIVFDGAGDPIQKPSVYGSGSPIDVAFSPDGMEMFVANHFIGALDRYLYDELNTPTAWRASREDNVVGT